MMSMNLSDNATLNIKGSNYRYVIALVIKNEAINLMQNSDLTEKNGTLWNKDNLFSYVKMDKEILTFGNTEIEKKKKKNYRHKTPTFLGDVDIKKVLVSNKISFGEKKCK